MQVNNNQQNKVRINFYIRAPQVKVVANDGTFLGIMETREAIKLAQEQGMDLIEINSKNIPPICRIAELGKFMYEQKKKSSEAKKKQKVQELKEIAFRPNTDENDLKHKLELTKQFLQEGHKVKLIVKFRGREITHPQVGREKLDWILQQLNELILPGVGISMEGKLMITTVSPNKQK